LADPKESAEQKGKIVPVVSRQPAADRAAHEQAEVRRKPLHRLQAAGQPARFADFDHQRVGKHVRERDAEGWHKQEHHDQPALTGQERHERRDAEADGGGDRRNDQVTAAARPEQGHEIGQQREQRLQRPRQRHYRHEGRDRGGAFAPALEQRAHGLGDQAGARIADALNEIKRAEQQAETGDRRARNGGMG
jgi:hypothetical protein